ncbi:dihydrofolate reductase [Cellulomonas soli]|uniref:Dihydrofolate reductase n=1 Tax=Cellulomonas soli TaxID=931535 RepID=A0A512PBM5_9CELL|nr:dihydrofolate reductase [Cellulomonas soli]NYI61018.1 dihydrofolate reductase [Cellulomonas soli]GEP68566.1 dihydrofolate reductase [Cellulomonas soli]
MTIALIWARTADGVIGRDGTLPWRLPEDLARFRRLTDGCAVVMGRTTWESLPPRLRPLPGRRNVVLTRSAGYEAPGAEVVGSLEEAWALVGAHDEATTVWVVGGGAVYAQALPLATRVEETVVDVAVEGDTWAPVLDPATWTCEAQDPATGWHASARDGLRHRFETWRRTG